jgi:hypothetical protein
MGKHELTKEEKLVIHPDAVITSKDDRFKLSNLLICARPVKSAFAHTSSI